MKAELRDLRDELHNLERARRSYLAQLRVLVERQLAEIQASETATLRAPANGDNDDQGGSRTVAAPTPSWLDSLMKE
jgi:hypothetical protein